MSSLHELMNYTLVSKYARWIADKKRRETWKEAVDRVRNMMLDFYADKGLDKEINWAYDMMLKKKVLGSQRALQLGGEPALKKHARIYNCTSSYCDRPRFFQECFWLLLCGCGTGFSVQKQHVSRLPGFRLNVMSDSKIFTIPDTIEGWSDAIGVLLTNHLDAIIDERFAEYAKCGKVIFDYSQIRPAGSFLSSGVGKAPGPEGLRKALENVNALLERCHYKEHRDRLRPIDCYDIVMHMSDAVLSGGVRRSATICLFSADDTEMLTAKTGNWKTENGQRARSNNSAMLLRDSTNKDTFFSLLKYVREHGEPGFIWTNDLEMLINPCAEIGMWAYDIKDQDKYDKYIKTYDGRGYKVEDLSEVGLESGWQGCNLSTINCATIKGVPDFLERGRAAAIIGTLQAGFTSLDYLTSTSELIFQREALLGVSMTGAMEKFDIVLDPANQRDVAKEIVKTNKEFSKKIGINQAARNTCMKPEGCLHPSTLIATNKGILTLEEIGNIHGNKWQPHELTVLNSDLTYRNSAKFYNNGYTNTKRLTMSSNLILEGTNNHKVKVVDNDGNMFWKNLSLICNGDKIAYVVGGYQGGTSQILDIDYCTKKISLHDARKIRASSKTTKQLSKEYDVSQNNIREIKNSSIVIEPQYPKALTEDLAWFLGLYIGDGSNHTKGIRISGDKRHPDNLNRAIQIIRKYFGITGYIINQSEAINDNRCQCYFNSQIIKAWLKYNGLEKTKSIEITIPKIIRSEKRNILKSFIDGYREADGNSFNGYTTFCSVSINMARQLCSILRLLGYPTTIYKQLPTESSFGSNIRYIVTILKGKNGHHSNDAEKNRLYKLLPQHIYYDTVVNITDNKCHTLDINVDDSHEYLANAFVSHNTSSCLLGTSSSIHPHHSKRYLRTLQANRTENPYQHFRAINPQACEKSVWSANDTDDVLVFPIEVPDGAKTKNQIPALGLLEIVKSTQINWVNAGKNKQLCTQPWLSHNVSNTITVLPDEWDKVGNFIYDNRQYFCGIALLPQSGDKDYAQAPFTAVYTAREIVREYGDAALWTSGLIEIALDACGNLWTACDIVLYNQLNTKIHSTNGKGDSTFWHSIAKQCAMAEKINRFANKYFNGDVKRLTYCMKDVYNWKKYCDLVSTIAPVDYTTMIEEHDETKPEAEIACAGGACSLI